VVVNPKAASATVLASPDPRWRLRDVGTQQRSEPPAIRSCSEAAPQTAETKPVSSGAPSLHSPFSQPRYTPNLLHLARSRLQKIS